MSPTTTGMTSIRRCVARSWFFELAAEFHEVAGRESQLPESFERTSATKLPKIPIAHVGHHNGAALSLFTINRFRPDLIQHCRFRIARPVPDIDSHEGIACLMQAAAQLVM